MFSLDARGTANLVGQGVVAMTSCKQRAASGWFLSPLTCQIFSNGWFDAPLFCGRCYECGSLLSRTIVEGNYMNDDRAYAAMTFLPGLGFFFVSQKSCSRGFNNILLFLIGSWLQLRKGLLWCVVAVAGALEFTVKHGELLFVCWGKMATLVWRAKFFFWQSNDGGP